MHQPRAMLCLDAQSQTHNHSDLTSQSLSAITTKSPLNPLRTSVEIAGEISVIRIAGRGSG